MLLPPRLLSCTIDSLQPEGFWNEDDGSSDPFLGAPYRFTVTLTVAAQAHSSHRTREPYFYNGRDVAVGDWLADVSTCSAVRIESIVSANDSEVVCVVEDVERFNTMNDPSQAGTPINTGQAFIFQIGDDGLPIIFPLSSLATVLYNNLAFAIDLQSRFTYRNFVRSYFRVQQAGHGLAEGDVVRIRTSEPNIGTYEKVTGNSAVEGVVGVINSVGVPGVDWFTYRPSGRVVSNLTPSLPGNAGEFIFLDVDGAYTNVRPSKFAKPIFIRLSATSGLQVDRNIDPIPSVIYQIAEQDPSLETIGYSSQSYVVADLAARDALLGINTGDQVLVEDAGNGEWAQYIRSSAGLWHLLVSQDASHTDAETESTLIDGSAPATGTIATVSEGRNVTAIIVEVTSPFHASAALTIGADAQPALLMDANGCDLSIVGTYEVTPTIGFPVMTGDHPITYTLTQTAVSSGAAKITITYL